MSLMTDIVREPEFERRLVEARGDAALMRIFRGGDTGDYATEDRGSAILSACLDELGERIGLPIAEASIFCSQARTTVFVKFSVVGSDSAIGFFYDTLTEEASHLIMHPETMHIRFGSHSDLLAVHAEPEILLDLHMEDGQASAMREAVKRCGLRLAPPADGRMEYETQAFELQDA